MAKDQRNVEAITPMEEDFTKWYTDICLKAELVDYASVKGFLILRPYGYAIWENIQKYMDAEFKKTGHVNVAMPVLIPESLLKKEGELVEGFAPEVAWVTHGGSEPLEERLAFRPTSETMFCDHWAHVLHSYRELPMLYNQWCSVIRWEKTTRPFLRSREFWWQEGHTIHETAAEAEAETEQQLNCYADMCKNALAMPVVKGRKTDKEKFAGAEATYTIECMMKDHKALQSGTSHFFGDKFSRAYDVTFAGRDNTLQYPFQTSWGASTRLIGAIIMTHSDNHGLVLPPVIAPTQVVVIPIAQHKEGVLEAAASLRDRLTAAGIRVSMDDSDQSAGWKFAQYEMKGVPLRVEIGPKDMEKGQCCIARHTPLTDFWRVGRGYAKKLEENGLFTMGDIARCSIGKENELYNEDLLYKLFGVNAELLIDHAWGYEPCTMEMVKAYKPETNSVCSGQVLHCPYDFEKAKLVVKEMTDQMVLDLVDKKLVTDQIVLTVGYDIENLNNADRRKQYHGEVTIDRYGRRIPKHAHGTTNLKRQTSSTKMITDAVIELYDRIVDRNLLIRRINITANRLVDESSVRKEEVYEQLDLFTDYEAQRKKQEEEEAALDREKRMQEAMLSIKKKFGKNAVLKGMNLQEGATARDRNEQIGGHKA